MSHDHHHAPADHLDHDVLAEMLELDAEVLAPMMRSMIDGIEQAAGSPVRTILDLGAGTGAGTFALLRHFADARAVAVDASADMLVRLVRQAEHDGLTDRVTPLQADLDEGVPAVAPVDLVWASASLHHLADPDRTVEQVVDVVRPGGLLAVAELDGFPRFVPDDSPAGRAEGRVHALLAADRAVDLPTMGSDWGQRLAAAGFDVLVDRTISLDLEPPVPAVVHRYAFAVMTRVGGAVAGRLAPDDRQALDTLVGGGPDDVRHRDDLRVHAERRWLIARRPT